MKKATKVIVQTNHIKSLILKKVGVNVNVSVETPKLTITNKLKRSDFVIITKLNLFYPTSPAIYKNYISLFRALLDLPVRLHSKINLIITINENYSKEVLNFKKRMDYLGISNQFIGRIDQIDVLNILNESVLVFPSLIESLGLPILEAKILDRYIIAINKDYTHELLDDYKKVMFFDHNNSNQIDLRNKILYAIENIKC
jgi:glycosyltransferase involved in cell wall biosynthesis